MKHTIGSTIAIFLFFSLGASAADFDGDGVADEFTLTRDAAKAARDATIRLANPWTTQTESKRPPKGLGVLLRLSRLSKTYLLCDPDFLGSPIWTEPKPPVEVITKQDRRYRAWKKEVPELRHDALKLQTEAGIDILLYWTGKEWRVFWPNEEP